MLRCQEQLPACLWHTKAMRVINLASVIADHVSHNQVMPCPAEVVACLQSTVAGVETVVCLQSTIAEARLRCQRCVRARRSGALTDMRAAGVEAVDCVSVDNALARVADPLFAGFCWERRAQCGAPGTTAVMNTQSPTSRHLKLS